MMLANKSILAKPARQQSLGIVRWTPCPLRSLGLAASTHSRRSAACFARSTGGVVDSPTVAPTYQQGVERVQKRPPTYKVMLHNDNYNRREYVVKTLVKVVEGYTVDDAVTVMQEAHETGVAVVIACAQEEAERYVEGLRLNGLTSTMEPGC